MTALIGALRVSLSADTAKFEQGMKRAQRTAHTSTTAISKSLNVVKAGLLSFASALTVGMLTVPIARALDYASSLGEVAQQLGVTTRDLQVFRYAATQAGISEEQMDKALQRLTKSMGDALAGSDTMIRAFGAIGISVDDLRGKDAGEVLRMMADGLKDIPNAAQRAAVETAIFGRAGQQLDTLLAGGSGAINELATAADELGIVLSDEQIQKADETADKLAAMKTVLEARIAGVVSDNADAILELANALSDLVSTATRAAGAIATFYARAKAEAAKFHRDHPFAANLLIGDIGKPPKLGNSATIKLPPPRKAAPPADTNIEQFLAPSGGGGRAKRGGKSAEQIAAEAARRREEAERKQFRFEQDILRADRDILSAKQSLSLDEVERYALGIQILDKEREIFAHNLAYEVAQGDITEAQAAILQAKYDERDAAERQQAIQEASISAKEQSARLDQLSADIQRGVLESEAGLAETAKERRAAELRLLDYVYRQERARLATVIAEEEAKELAQQNVERLESARRRLAGLNQTYGNDRAGVIAGTRGPMEDYLASLPTTAAKAQEALERLQVQGLEGLLDSALALSDGLDAAGESLLNTLKNFLLGMARMELQKGLGSLISGGVRIPGFATGGSGVFGGIPGVDRNLVSFNGMPAFKVSRGEHFNITPANDVQRGGRGDTYMTVVTPDADSFRRSERQIARQWQRRLNV